MHEATKALREAILVAKSPEEMRVALAAHKAAMTTDEATSRTGIFDILSVLSDLGTGRLKPGFGDKPEVVRTGGDASAGETEAPADPAPAAPKGRKAVSLMQTFTTRQRPRMTIGTVIHGDHIDLVIDDGGIDLTVVSLDTEEVGFLIGFLNASRSALRNRR